MKKSFILHLDSLQVIEDLSEAQKAELFQAIFDYNSGNEVKLSGLMKAVFRPFKNQFDRDNEKYQSIIDRNSNNGKMGGRPKTKENQKNPVGYLETQKNRTKPKKADNDNDSVSDSENVNVSDDERASASQNPKQPTTPPSFLSDKSHPFFDSCDPEFITAIQEGLRHERGIPKSWEYALKKKCMARLILNLPDLKKNIRKHHGIETDDQLKPIIVEFLTYQDKNKIGETWQNFNELQKHFMQYLTKKSKADDNDNKTGTAKLGNQITTQSGFGKL